MKTISLRRITRCRDYEAETLLAFCHCAHFTAKLPVLLGCVASLKIAQWQSKIQTQQLLNAFMVIFGLLERMYLLMNINLVSAQNQAFKK